jgi:hypothetical protein
MIQDLISAGEEGGWRFYAYSLDADLVSAI